jgi:hypothetical protein
MTRAERYEGTLRRGSFGGRGSWTLDCGARTWELRGDVPAALEGRRVRVLAAASNAFSIAMTGPVLDVQRIEPVDG